MPDKVYNLVAYGFLLILKGDYEMAGDILMKVESLSERYAFPHPQTKALYLSSLGEKDKALAVDSCGIVHAFSGMKD